MLFGGSPFTSPSYLSPPSLPLSLPLFSPTLPSSLLSHSLFLFPFHFPSTYFSTPFLLPILIYQMSKGSELLLDVSPSTTVGDLRKMLYGTIGLPLESIEIKCQVGLLHLVRVHIKYLVLHLAFA